jgi:hypothetical protein
MSTDPEARSDEDIVKEIVKPIEELLAREDEELKKMDETIREVEQKGKAVLHPEP